LFILCLLRFLCTRAAIIPLLLLLLLSLPSCRPQLLSLTFDVFAVVIGRMIFFPPFSPKHYEPSFRVGSGTGKANTTATAQCDVDVTIESDGDVSQLNSCSKLDGTINIKKGVSQILFPTGLSSISGDLVIDGATGLTSFTAPGLKTISGSFKLNGLTVLSTLACPELVSVGDISWSTLPALQTLSFTKKVSKANTVLITDTLLTSLEGINLVTAERFNINNNRYLRSVDVAIGNVTDVLIIEANGKGVNASFPNLKWANNITIRDAGDVYFPVLEEVRSSAAFVNNTFTTVEFPELTEVGESLAFVSCSRLTTIKANSLEEVGGTFQLANNTKLAVIDGFEKLAVVGGAVDLSGVFTK